MPELRLGLNDKVLFDITGREYTYPSKKTEMSLFETKKIIMIRMSKDRNKVKNSANSNKSYFSNLIGLFSQYVDF